MVFPQSRLTYAVGDIHGRLDLLVSALDAIDRHARGLETRIVFLGDYVDRGADSRGVIDLLMAVQRERGAICLKGNHEDLMVRALTECHERDFARWRVAGGNATLRSYGAARENEAMQTVPREHVRWLAGLPLTTAEPGRLFVHAGIAPRTPFHKQKEATLLWIREPFLRARAKDMDVHVVHGHTPLWAGKSDPARPELLPHRTNLDTGAFATGVLSIGVFEARAPGGPLEILDIRGKANAHSIDELRGPPDPKRELPVFSSR